MKRKATWKGKSGPVVSVLFGLCAGLAVCLLGVLVITILIHNEHLAYNAMDYGILCLLLIGAFTATAVAILKNRERSFLVSIITGGALLLILLLGNLMFAGGKPKGLLVSALVILAGSMTAALTVLRKKKPNYAMKR